MRIFCLFLPFIAACAIVRADDGLEVELSQTTEVHEVGSLPVWTKTVDGETWFEPTLLIAYLKNELGRELWNQGRVIPNSGGLVVIHSRTGQNGIRKALAKLQAFSTTSVSDAVEEQLSRAEVGNQNVIVFVSDLDSEATDSLFDLRYDDGHEQLHLAMKNFRVQCVAKHSVHQIEILNAQRATLESGYLCVLDPVGNIISTATLGSLSENGRLIDAELVGFLHSSLPNSQDADELFESAVATARKEDKKVFLVHSGPSCLPCDQLLRFLKAEGSVLGRDYIMLKLDSRMRGSKQIVDKYRGNGGRDTVPWMAVLSGTSELLISSDGKSGNIGFPRTAEAAEHFAGMLNLTAKHLSADEISSLIDRLRIECTRLYPETKASPLAPPKPNVQ